MIRVAASAWPELEVAPAIYRFRLLNGCNSRFLNLSMFRLNKKGKFNKEIPFYQIGAEQSLMPQVVEIITGKATPLTPGVAVWDRVNGPFKDQALLMGLAERADVLVTLNTCRELKGDGPYPVTSLCETLKVFQEMSQVEYRFFSISPPGAGRSRVIKSSLISLGQGCA